MNDMSAENGEAGIYIIDHDYRIIYMNDMARSYYPDLKAGMYCYQGIEKESSPCPDCPDISQSSGHVIFYNTVSQRWLDVSSGKIDWPGYGECRLIMFRPVDERNKNLFYNLADNTVYDELFELNPGLNTYKILFQQKEKYMVPEMKGQLDTMFLETADTMIHPQDRDAFLEFWDLSTLLDRLHANGKIMKGEFRRKLSGGEYGWACLSAVLFRYGDCEGPVIMCYVQDIDVQKKKEEEEQRIIRNKREETDSLTGLLRYGPFFEKAELLLKNQSGTEYFMVAIDIEHFKLFNEWYGEEEGDRFLVRIGSRLKAAEEFYASVAGYMGGDDFVIILPEDLSILKSLEDEINDYARQYGGNAGFLPAFGIYRIEDRSLPVGIMYDRAAIALNSVKGNYTRRIGWYDPSMKQKMENDQVLLSEIQRALEKKEFIFYVQPQCNMVTGKIIGLESLVRWQHPDRGMVTPGEFIPLLERNGFITYLDLYIWEMVCLQLSSWINMGIRPVPVSVNMSRMDIYAIDVVEKFKELVDKYGIEPKFLEIEITESAYAEDYDLIRKVVEELRRAGFPVFMDDFGSGYSSLNMLKDVNVDVIKIDTKFLDMNENSRSRGMGILETIVRMARVMQLKVIAEGVEEKEQVDFLKNIGCIYGQGYYYYKPLAIGVAQALLMDEDNVDFRGIQARQMRQLKLEDLFNEDITSETMLNNMLGAIALYDVFEDRCEVLRVNEEYYRVTGDNPVDMEERRRYVLSKIYKDDIDWLLNIFENAYGNPVRGAEGIFRRYRSGGELMWVHLRVFFLREQDGHRLYYGSVRDATEQMEQRRKLEDSQKILGDVLKLAGRNISFENIAQENQWAASAIFAQVAPGGLLGIYCEKGFPLYFANNEMLRLLDYDSYEIFAAETGGKIGSIIHPEDLKLIQENILRYVSPGMEYSFRHRMKKRDGSWLWLMTKGRVVQAEDGRLAIVSACMDITDTVLAQKELQDTNEVLRFKNDELEALRRQVEESRKILDQMDRMQWESTEPPDGEPDSGGFSRMREYMACRRIQSSALVLFELCRPRKESAGASKTGKLLFDRLLEQLTGYFREDDIICQSGEYRVMVLCKNIRENDMENKLKRIGGSLNQAFTAKEARLLLPSAAGFVMIEIHNRDFDGSCDRALLALEQARQTEEGGCAKYE
ncbi:EAL domain-containing protein [Lachnospiraceae bacterium 54-53]